MSKLCGEMDVFVLIINFKLPQAEVHFKNSVSATGLTEEHCIDFFSRLRFSSLCFLDYIGRLHI